MNIDETNFPTVAGWEGELMRATGMLSVPGERLPALSISKPVWWSDQTLMGEGWTPPATGRRYGLTRFAYSIRPAERQSVRYVDIVVYLHAKGDGLRPVVFDLLPKAAKEEQAGTLTVGISPDFKFVAPENAPAALSLRQNILAVTADGLGENAAHWAFAVRSTTPLAGSQATYIIVELMPGVEAARASLQLVAEIDTPYGPVRGLLPSSQRNALSWVLE
ncbi:MAG: hypothetical protein HYZ49_06080 [Chloroflexi bacterium]|nr:hypothetical protein [Chloroflexota bacterium]